MSTSRELPKVSILIPTYNRHSVLAENIQHLYQNLIYRGGLVEILVGDDSDDPAQYDANTNLINILAETSQQHPTDNSTTTTFTLEIKRNNPRLGLGANLNMLIGASEADLFLQMDDDHILKKPLDLAPHVSYLLEDETAGWIRFYGVGGHKFVARLEDYYWRVSWHSPELYIPSNRPHLKHRRFHETYGMYSEGLRLGATEEGFCHQSIDGARLLTMSGRSTVDVMIPLDWPTESGWEHIGDSWQGKGF